MGVRAPSGRFEWEDRPLRFAPTWRAAALVVALVLAVLLANGRPIPAGDTRPTERLAASLVLQGNLDLDEYPDVEPPFAREVAGHRVSIYPALSALLAAPVFALTHQLFQFDELGLALAGKLAAVLCAALAAGLMFLAIARRHGEAGALAPALLFALGTSVWSTSQALWQHPAAVLFLSWAVLCLVRADEDDAWAARAGLPLTLALAARHASVAAVAVLALSVVVRWPRRALGLMLWGLPGVLFMLGYQWFYFGSPWRHGFSGAVAARLAGAWGEGHLGLLVSPAKGLLVFSPLVLVCVAGLVRAWRKGERGLASSLGLAALAHWLLVGGWAEWHGGVCFGPRLMTEALPLLALFVPEGLRVLGRAGLLLAGYSVAVQALGAFTYDMRWERLYARTPEALAQALWAPLESPLPFHVGQRVLLLAMPGLNAGRLVLREHPLVVLGPSGARAKVVAGQFVVSGGDATFSDLHLQRGARVGAADVRLQGRWDALFLRVVPGARARRLELRVRGQGQGTLYIGERSYWNPTPRWSAYPMAGAFRVRHPYHYPDSGGPDLLVSLGKTGGSAQIQAVALLAPNEPDEAIELP